MDSQEKKDLKNIRYYKGSVKQFKQMFDLIKGLLIFQKCRKSLTKEALKHKLTKSIITLSNFSLILYCRDRMNGTVVDFKRYNFHSMNNIRSFFNGIKLNDTKCYIVRAR